MPLRLQAPVDRPGSDAEELRGQALVASGLAQRLVDQDALDLIQLHAQGDDDLGPITLDRPLLGRALDGLREVAQACLLYTSDAADE